jgi:hypothetical protein
VPRTPRARRLNPPHKQARPRTPPRYEYRAGAPEPTAADGGMAPPRWPRAAPALRPAPGTRPLWPPRRGPRRRTPRPRPRSTPPASNGGDIEAPWGSKLLTDADKLRARRLNHRRFTHRRSVGDAVQHVVLEVQASPRLQTVGVVVVAVVRQVGGQQRRVLLEAAPAPHTGEMPTPHLCRPCTEASPPPATALCQEGLGGGGGAWAHPRYGELGHDRRHDCPSLRDETPQHTRHAEQLGARVVVAAAGAATVGPRQVQRLLLLARRARNSSGTATQCTRRNDSPPDTGGSMRSPQRPPRLPPPPGRCCQGGRRWSRCRTAAAAADAAGPAAARRHRLRPAAAGARTQRASSPAPPRSRTRTPAPPPACPRDRWQPGRGAVGRYPLVGHFCSLPPPKGMAALQRPHCHLCRHRPPRSGAATSRAGRRRPAAGPVPQRSRGGPW